MSLDRTAREKLVRALAESVIQHADELTSLDQAIGDGDHGLNMKASTPYSRHCPALLTNRCRKC
jgi:dihydroxyacetone kinase